MSICENGRTIEKNFCQSLDELFSCICCTLETMKEDSNEVITVTFFKNVNTIEIHTPRFIGNEPMMYDLVPYLQRSTCIGVIDKYPYNSVVLKNSSLSVSIKLLLE